MCGSCAIAAVKAAGCLTEPEADHVQLRFRCCRRLNPCPPGPADAVAAGGVGLAGTARKWSTSSDRLVTVSPAPTVREARSGSSCLTGTRLGMAAVLCARLLLLWLLLGGPGAGRMCRALTLPRRDRALRAALHCVLSLPDTWTVTAGTWSKQQVAWRQERSCWWVLLLLLSGSAVLGVGAPERRSTMLRVACVALELLVVLTRRRLATSRPGRRSTTAWRDGGCGAEGEGRGRGRNAGFSEGPGYRHACIAQKLFVIKAVV